jgi:hypothetical protein
VGEVSKSCPRVAEDGPNGGYALPGIVEGIRMPCACP